MAKKKILLVEDEPDILELIDEEFAYAGYETLTANCGNEAVEILKNQVVDVVLSDYKMPNGDGKFLLDHVNDMSKKPLFFFVSGHVDFGEEELKKMGVKKLFAKPFDLDELINTIGLFVN